MCWLWGGSAWFPRSIWGSTSVSYRRLPRQVWSMNCNRNKIFILNNCNILTTGFKLIFHHLNAWIQLKGYQVFIYFEFLKLKICYRYCKKHATGLMPTWPDGIMLIFMVSTGIDLEFFNNQERLEEFFVGNLW